MKLTTLKSEPPQMDRENSPPCTKPRRTGESPHLSEEFNEEILPRLPVKSLLRFRCVSKSWGSLIGSKRFIKAQHQNSIKNPSFPQQRVILQKDVFDWPEQHSLQSLLSEPPILTSRLDDPTNTTFSRMRFQILGCYDGLLCILEELSRIHLWNPSTRISKKLPEISNGSYVRNFGFGWVESSGEYKVFVLYQWKWVGNVYSSKTKSWKTIELCDDLVSCCVPGIFAGGKLYWKKMGDNKYKEDIIFLDLKSEVFGRIELPFDQEFGIKKYCFVGVLGGFLCVLYYNNFSNYKRGVRVWVMKEHGMEESWERVETLAHLVELLQPTPLVVGQKGEILVNCGSTLLVYYHRDDVFHFRVPYSLHHVYVESLVSPEDM